ncbi:MAG: hypothetical protein ACFFDD_11685 [Promethearchaeota archaeon]
MGELIELVLQNVANRQVSTDSLLYYSKELASLLGLAEKDVKWIDYEIEGYPEKKDVPKYREVEIWASVSKSKTLKRGDPGWNYYYPLIGTRKKRSYLVLGPIGDLETAEYDAIFDSTETHDVPKGEDDISGQIERTIKIEIPYRAILTLRMMRLIVSAVRKRVYDFVLGWSDSIRKDSPDSFLIHDEGVFDVAIFEKLTTTNDFVILAEEINQCFKFACYTAAGVLSRKLLENLLYHVLEKAYKGIPEKMDLIYNEHRHMIQGFSVLIDVFKENYNDDFRKYGGISKKTGIQKQIQNLTELRDVLDMATHNLPVFLSEPEFREVASKAEITAKFLRRMSDSMP